MKTSFEILCEDGPLLAVNKPAGMISQGAPVGAPSLVEEVKQYLREKYHKPGNVYLGIPHRLDRPVSGVMVFSRNSKCAARLAEQFAKRTVRKTYLVILESPPSAPMGELEDWIRKVPDHSRVVIARPDNQQAKHARLSYETIAVHRGKALVRVHLHTGRMHQIRVQFGSRGCPVWGDTQYGGTSWHDDTAIALHAFELTLQHPVRYEEITLQAPVPKHWNELGFHLTTN